MDYFEVLFLLEDGKLDLEYFVNGFVVFNNKDENKVKVFKKFIIFIVDDKKWGLKDVICIGVFLVRILFGDFYKGDKCMMKILKWI